MTHRNVNTLHPNEDNALADVLFDERLVSCVGANLAWPQK